RPRRLLGEALSGDRPGAPPSLPEARVARRSAASRPTGGAALIPPFPLPLPLPFPFPFPCPNRERERGISSEVRREASSLHRSGAAELGHRLDVRVRAVHVVEGRDAGVVEAALERVARLHVGAERLLILERLALHHALGGAVEDARAGIQHDRAVA